MDGGGRCQKRSQAAGELNNTAQAQECWIAATGSSAATDFAATQQGLSRSLDQALSVRDHQVASRISIAAGGAQIPHYRDSSGKTGESFVATALVSSRSSAVLFPPLPRASFSAGEVTRSSTRQCRSLASLCVGYLGEHLEDIIDDIHEIAPAFPVEVKGKLLAIARRRRLLCDELLVALADSSWEILDVSGSDVTDASIEFVAILCHRLQDVDISHCSRLTAKAVEALVQHCSALRTLRCGGTPKSDMTARRSLSYILPRLDHKEEAEESWENLDTKSVGKGAQALRWLVWPSIDSNSKELLEVECPRIVVNPVASWKTFGLIPREAQRGIVLDNPLIEDIDPKTWAVVISSRPQRFIGSTQNKDNGGLSVAERFRLAFVSRDERLAPKRAKNMRQNQRRADKAWLSSDSKAKAQVWAGIAHKSLKHLCKHDGVICEDIISAALGTNCCVNHTRFTYYLEWEPQPTSTKDMQHLAQMIRSGLFSFYDYGTEGNLKVYNQIKAPLYNLATIPKELPLFLISGGNDQFADPEDVEKLQSDLLGDVTALQIADYAHGDLLLSTRANIDVNAPILAYFKELETRSSAKTNDL